MSKDYALWEVIINGDSSIPEPPAVGTFVPPKTKAQKLAKKYELKAKTIKIRFGGNKESKKMHKTILKQQYENFVASRSEGLDKTYDSINETINVAHDIPAAGSKEQPSASSYADDVMFSFFASQSNTPQLNNEDLEQIDIDDLKEMDLKWQVAMITIRVKKFMKKTWRNLNFNGKEPVGFDKTRVECYNCHIRGHFARECRAPRNKGNRNSDNERRIVLVETLASALVVHDELVASDSSVSEIDEDNNQAKDMYKVRIGYHAVPPPYTGNYMPPRVNVSFAGLDDSVFKFRISETRTSVSENELIASKSSEEIREEPKTVRSIALIIED
nr:ribonuclease H-like domain-containing protein [Tanacetum cinerariifolium]